MPQLLEEKTKNFEFPKYYIVTPPPLQVQGTFVEQGRNYPGVCGGGGVTPSISLGIPVQFSRAKF
jgi:hypothetical protein